jgi:hypothetical protein
VYNKHFGGSLFFLTTAKKKSIDIIRSKQNNLEPGISPFLKKIRDRYLNVHWVKPNTFRAPLLTVLLYGPLRKRVLLLKQPNLKRQFV